MYPESNEAALLEQMEAERAIGDLVEMALEIWLPLAEKSVLQAAAPPPDPTAAADQDGQWNYLVDALILYGIGVLASSAFDRAYTAITGAPLAIAERTPTPTPEFDMPGMPTRASLRARARAALRRRTGVDAEVAEARMNSVPELREFVSGHLENIRGRVMDAVGRVFRRSRQVTQDAPPEEAREEVEVVFDPLDWQAAVDLVGQTQATGALNAATSGAASASGRAMLVEWVAIIDSHTRDAHENADGQTQPPGQPFSVGGESLRFPGDPRGSIENIVNCRCRLFARFTEPDPELVAAARRFAEAADGQPYQFGHAAPDATMATETEESKPMEYRSFESVLAVIGTPTDDGRMFAEDIDLSFRDFPLPLMWCKQSSGGHYDAYTVGVIEEARIDGTKVVGSGYFLNSAEALEAVDQAEHGVTGPSVDLGATEWELRDGDGNPVTEEDYWTNPDMELVQVVLAAKVLAATLVSTPAFGETSITLGEMVERGEEALVAAAAVIAPEHGPSIWPASYFTDPGFTEPTYPHMTEDGRVQGHLAVWNVCHVGIQDRCVLAPKSATDYAWFHTAPPVTTTEGKAKVGRLTVGGGHAGPKLGPGPAIAHYDDVGTCFALVHVGEDAHGVWFSGVPAPGATSEQIAMGLAAPLSGDWRTVAGNYELVAALAVNTPGFPIVASGATDEDDAPLSLIASLGPCSETAAEAPPSGTDPLELARHIVNEWRAAERRDIEARELVAAETRRQAAALIEGMA